MTSANYRNPRNSSEDAHNGLASLGTVAMEQLNVARSLRAHPFYQPPAAGDWQAGELMWIEQVLSLEYYRYTVATVFPLQIPYARVHFPQRYNVSSRAVVNTTDAHSTLCEWTWQQLGCPPLKAPKNVRKREREKT